ncbi:alpha/beta-hydrolase [Rickenella mellea]|uniref:Alpha/beta-hydrolase n=1 Tax=Rickenella mellea TaxID=50990 RepID=A0A4Y7QGT8_9AGAM|nr:alpha/beta-hydrolase [Rickenella mellea]
MLAFLLPISVLLGSSLSLARPTDLRQPLMYAKRDAAPTPVDAATVQSFARPAEFARIAYCTSQAVLSWKCGAPCDALSPGVDVLTAGGDSADIPFYYIAHDNATQSIVVAHQGTDAKSILSIANDAQFLLDDLDAAHFPGAPAGIKVHDGFQKTFLRTADGKLNGVKAALNKTGVKKVLVTGHSLGAAIATMDALMFKLNLDPSIDITTTVFGLPRGGNPAFADFIDQKLGSSFTFLTNKNDPVPTVPPQFIGYKHSQGEVHIQSDGSVVACPGQENNNCSEGNSLLKVSVANHLGPYVQNVSMSHSNCPL